MRRQLFQLLAIALLAGLVPGITAARAETPITLSITPAIAGNTAVHAGQAVLVSGTAPRWAGNRGHPDRTGGRGNHLDSGHPGRSTQSGG